ncbi:unnamed protein product [Phytophthora fragariaefolia]|uniref:Unnamed protein product n=1 Tax=Phytophthora fragariaefolia TaxID=1490495 RepID=A0A9W6WWD7_9STRA|nr:unnamed protein product [Phytophthora fragariaefolia]
MGRFRAWVALAALCNLTVGEVAIGGDDVEVELGPDGAVVGEKGAWPGDSAAADVAMAAPVESHAAPMETKRAAALQSQRDAVSALQRELALVEQMVTLQGEKLQLLEKMRGRWLQQLQETRHEHEQARDRRVDVREVIDRTLEAVAAERRADGTAKDFNAYFVARAELSLAAQVADVKMLKMHATSATELIAVAYSAGGVVLFSSDDEQLLRVDTGRPGIKSIALEAQDRKPCLLVTYDAPVVGVYELNVEEKSKGSSEEGQAPNSDQRSAFVSSRKPECVLSVSEHRDIALSRTASAIAIARSSRQLILAVAEASGDISFFALNGTMLRQIETGATITAMETNRNLLVFTNGTKVVVSSMTRAQGSVFHVCPGSLATITSLAFDAVHPEILYAGTQRGEILAYAVSPGSAGETQTCRLLSRSTLTAGPRDHIPLALAVTKTYVIAAGPHNLAVFNVSKNHKNDISLSRVCTTHLSTHFPDVTSHAKVTFQAMSFSEGVMGSHLAFVAGTENQPKLILLHSLLPEQIESSDFPWTVFLYAGVVIIAVVVSQLCIRWQKQSTVNPWDSVGKTHGKYGRFNGHNDEEFDGEKFGRYNSLSDELRRKIAQAKKGSAQRSIDDEADY